MKYIKLRVEDKTPANILQAPPGLVRVERAPKCRVFLGTVRLTAIALSIIMTFALLDFVVCNYLWINHDSAAEGTSKNLCSIEVDDRQDCMPESNPSSEEECLALECCWLPAADNETMPSCFAPLNETESGDDSSPGDDGFDTSFIEFVEEVKLEEDFKEENGVSASGMKLRIDFDDGIESIVQIVSEDETSSGRSESEHSSGQYSFLTVLNVMVKPRAVSLDEEFKAFEYNSKLQMLQIKDEMYASFAPIEIDWQH